MTRPLDLSGQGKIGLSTSWTGAEIVKGKTPKKSMTAGDLSQAVVPHGVQASDQSRATGTCPTTSGFAPDARAPNLLSAAIKRRKRKGNVSLTAPRRTRAYLKLLPQSQNELNMSRVQKPIIDQWLAADTAFLRYPLTKRPSVVDPSAPGASAQLTDSESMRLIDSKIITIMNKPRSTSGLSARVCCSVDFSAFAEVRLGEHLDFEKCLVIRGMRYLEDNDLDGAEPVFSWLVQHAEQTSSAIDSVDAGIPERLLRTAVRSFGLRTASKPRKCVEWAVSYIAATNKEVPNVIPQLVGSVVGCLGNIGIEYGKEAKLCFDLLKEYADEYPTKMPMPDYTLLLESAALVCAEHGDFTTAKTFIEFKENYPLEYKKPKEYFMRSLQEKIEGVLGKKDFKAASNCLVFAKNFTEYLWNENDNYEQIKLAAAAVYAKVQCHDQTNQCRFLAERRP